MSLPRQHLLAALIAAFAISVAAYYVLIGAAPSADAPPAQLASSDQAPAPANPAAPLETQAPPAIPIARILIPAIGVDAAVEIRSVSSDGVMQDPTGPRDVAWYNFTALPNQAGNIVMSGHLDYVNYGAAVFYELASLQEGDEVVLELIDGGTVAYRVTTVDSYDAATAPVQEIVGPTEVETVTLITCGGAFNRTTRQYDERIIVRAERA